MAELVVLAFQDEATAERALAALQRLQGEGNVLTLRDWALAVRGEGESVRVVRSSDPPATSGRIAFAGGAMGAIIGGLLFVPVAGLMVGTLIGATMGRRRETGVDPTFAQDLSAALEPGTAALFLYVVANDADRAIEGVKPFSPRVVRTSLSAEDEAALRSRFEAATAEEGAGAGAMGPGAAAPEGLFERQFGRWYPRDFVVALVDGADRAQQVVSALREAEFPEGEIAFREGEQVLQQVEAYRAEEGRVQRAVGSMQEHVSSEGQLGRRYREAAQRGEVIVAVRAEAPDRIDAARRVLRAHGARDMHHFGRWAVTDLN